MGFGRLTLSVLSVAAHGRSQKNVVLEIKSKVSPNTVKDAETYKREKCIEEFSDVYVSVKTAQTSFPMLQTFVPDPTHVAQVYNLPLYLTCCSFRLKI